MKNRLDIIWLDSTDSTNDEARRRLAELSEVTAIAALDQTAGRGQRGNTWSSKAGENLTFSIILKFGNGAFPKIKAENQFAISEIAALSVVEFLIGYGIEAKIKWPNDIYVGSRKICGILAEHSICGSFISSSIIGVGLNVNQTSFDPSIPNPTSMSLQSASEKNYDIELCLNSFMDIFMAYMRRYMNITGGLARLDKLYISQLWRLGQEHQFIDQTTCPPMKFRGTIKGVSPIGRLKVEMKEGGLKEFAFKEISYMLDC